MSKKQQNVKKFYFDFTDKSLSNFKNLHSLSLTTSSSSNLKTSKLGDIYDVKQIGDKMNKLCEDKLNSKSVNDIQLNTHVSKKICKCLFEKNKNLTINDLEYRINNRHDTPASHCITILDKYAQKTHKPYVQNLHNKQNNASIQSGKSGKSSKSNQSIQSRKSSKSIQSRKSSKSSKSNQSRKSGNSGKSRKSNQSSKSRKSSKSSKSIKSGKSSKSNKSIQSSKSRKSR